MYVSSDLEISLPPAPSAIAIPANGKIISGFKILWNAVLIMDKQLATIMNTKMIPPIKNNNEHPITSQNSSSHSPLNSKSGSSKHLSIIRSISPDIVKVYPLVAVICDVIPSEKSMM